MANFDPVRHGYFKFKGVSSNDMKVYMLGLPTRPVPAEKGEKKSVEGRDGDLWISEHAYKRITVKCKLECAADADIDAINAWLSGAGDLVFMDEPNRCYKARCIEDIPRDHSSPRRLNRNWNQQFDCEPFRYEAEPAEDFVFTETAQIIHNPSSIEALPFITMNVNGNATLMIGGVNTIMVSDYTGIIHIDCDAKIAYTGEGTAASPRILLNHKCSGEFPVIPSGYNGVMFTGVSSVTIKPRWRWI